MASLPLTPSVHIRPVSAARSGPSDAELVLGFVDSQLPHLAAIGSGGQWGSAAHGSDAAAQERYGAFVAKMDAQAARGEPFGSEWARGFIAEREGRAVGALILEGQAASYAQSVLPSGAEPFVYVRFLVTDRDAGAASRGVGRILLDYAAETTRALGISRLCLDCWRGNERRLVLYYESLGFVPLGDVANEKEGGEVWEATVMEKRVV